MDKPTQTPTTSQTPTNTTVNSPSSSIEPKTSLLSRLKNSRKNQISVTVLSLVFLIAIAVGIQLFTSRSQVQFDQKPVVFPSPQARQTTQFATHPTVLETQSQVASSEAQLNDLKINNHPLLPPILDMQVTLEK